MPLCFILYSQLLVILFEGIKHIALHVYEVLYTGSLQLVHACGSTGNDEEGTVVEILEGGDGVGGSRPADENIRDQGRRLRRGP